LGNADDGGGAIMIYSGTINLINSTIVNSQSATHGGAISVWNASGNLDIKNSILWNNIASADSTVYNGNGGAAAIEYSLLQDAACPADVTCGDGMMYNQDPVFVGSTDFHLSTCSPALDKGSNLLVPVSVTTDLDGNPRFYNDGTVDLGSYELQQDFQYCCPSGNVVFVDENATGQNTGETWADAFLNLQDALSLLSSGDCPGVTEIWVAGGTYYPDQGVGYSDNDRNASFVMLNNLAIYGGFAGTEEPLTFDLADRNFVANETILSGDLLGDDGPDFADNADNSYTVVLTNTGTDATAILDGFTVTAGNANAGGLTVPDSRGGGMYNGESSAPTISNCNFLANTADFGGGMYNFNSAAPIVTSCTFTGNYTPNWGGAMLNEAESNVIMSACTFSNNEAGSYGGAICYSSAYSTLTDCVFEENAAGSIALAWGGAVTAIGLNSSSAPFAFTRCRFQGNTATGGGAAILNSNSFSSPDDVMTFDDCIFTENICHDGSDIGTGGAYQCGNVNSKAVFTNCLFDGNKGLGVIDDGGGTIMIYAGEVTLINSTIVNSESATNGGAVSIVSTEGSLLLINSILWNNSAVVGNSIFNGYGGSASVEYSLLQDNACPANVSCGDGMIYIADPVFEGPADFHLRTCSPAMDKGSNGLVPAGITTDLDGNPRFYNDGTVDLGAYELQEDFHYCCPPDNVVFVDADAIGKNTGETWADAFVNLQDALSLVGSGDCAGVDEIWVAGGTYYPDQGVGYTDNERTHSFIMRNNLAIYGGFEGTEDPMNFDLADRDFAANETILSGDIDQNDQPDFVNYDGNSYHVIYNLNNGLNNTAILDGFTVSGGNSPDHGGGMFIALSSPVVRNCSFILNKTANYGGGMYIQNSTTSLSDCFFSGNIAENGGGLGVYLGVNLELMNCSFDDNSAQSFGGGIFSWSNLAFTDCTISENYAPNAGGIFFGNGVLEMTNCFVMDNNTQWQGSGINIQDSPESTLTNCLVTGNSSENSHGGIANYNFNSQISVLNLINTTVANNTSQAPYGAVWSAGSNPVTNLKNTLVANNTPGNFYADEGATVASFVSLGNNLDSDGSSGFVNSVEEDIVGFDPLFIAMDDFHLQACSPAIDGGENTGAPTDDVDGNPRPFSPMGYAPATVDIGCYEYSISADICATCPVLAFAGNDHAILYTEDYMLSDAAADNYIALSWSTAGDGEFDDDEALNPTYTPGPDDIAAGSVLLTLSVEGLNACGNGDNDEMILTIYRPPTVEIVFPSDGDVFFDYPITALGTAADPDGDLTEVYVNLNNGGWELATGTDAWTKDLTLVIGENLIQAKAVDAQGLESDVVEITVIEGVQIIPLIQGWSVISSFLIPLDPSLEMVMADVGIPGNLTIMLGKEGIFWPDHNINSIGNWNLYEGYKVKYKNADELTIMGEKPADNNVTFSPGFHLIPVLSSVPVQISQIFSDPVNDVKYLFDLATGQIYWPQGGILTLSELVPGRGYLANFKTEVTIDFPDVTNYKSAFIPGAAPIAQLEGPWDYSRSGNVHQISVDHDAARTLGDASFIGAFDAGGSCIGSAEINHTDGNYLLTVFGDDATTAAKDGAFDGEFLIFKAHDSQQNLDYDITPEFSDKMPDYTGQFKTNGMSSIVGFKEAATGFEGGNVNSLQVELFPNPAKEVVTLICPDYKEGAQCEAEFVNAGGKVAKRIQLIGKSTIIDLDELNPGVYFVKIASESGTVIKKLVIQ
jgi:hypothetical protein